VVPGMRKAFCIYGVSEIPFSTRILRFEKEGDLKGGFYRRSETKTKSPRICMIFFAGRTHVKSSTITPFHRSLPTRERMTRARMNEMIRAAREM